MLRIKLLGTNTQAENVEVKRASAFSPQLSLEANRSWPTISICSPSLRLKSVTHNKHDCMELLNEVKFAQWHFPWGSKFLFFFYIGGKSLILIFGSVIKQFQIFSTHTAIAQLSELRKINDWSSSISIYNFWASKKALRIETKLKISATINY